MTKKPMAKWLVDKLIDDGVMTSDRVTKHAKPRRCPNCRVFVLVGLDEFPHRVEVDPQPTTTAGEAFALLTGRQSYGRDRDELYERSAGRLAYRRADDNAVYITHECNSPPLPINRRFIPKPEERQDGPCPF